MSTISSREFNRDTAAAKRAAAAAPVIITDRGTPGFVLLSYAAYRRLTAEGPSLLDVLADPDAADIELDITRDQSLPRGVELT